MAARKSVGKRSRSRASDTARPDDHSGFVFPRPSEARRVVVRFRRDVAARSDAHEFASAVGTDVSGANRVLAAYGNPRVQPTFAESPERLEAKTRSVSEQSGVDILPLSAFYDVIAANDEQAQEIARELEQLDAVEEAYLEPLVAPAVFDVPAVGSPVAPPATPSFVGRQGYLGPSPAGIDAEHAWTLAGGRGDGITVIDVEGAWNFSHEDLLQIQGGVVGGVPTGDQGWENHGTAVQGEIAGDRNDFGVVGAADGATFAAVSIFGDGNSAANAIKTAADRLTAGDVILIELHAPGPNATGQGQFGYIAVEWWSAEFAAVQYATAKGIIVIAAAGNGSQNLDDAVYGGRFDRTQRDSGALLVGAGAPPSGSFGPDRSRLDFSNYGSIVDAQGWGREVVTAGYGDLQGGGDKNRWYTQAFSGTSSASPIVVSAATCLQGIQKGRSGQPLTNIQLRDAFRSTGAPQVDGPNGPASQRIGNRPDLKAAAAYLFGQQQQISSGLATQYWIELVAYPAGGVRLWLLVNNAWKQLDDPSTSIQDIVQRAFLGTGSNVRAWYDNGTIVGLVVEGS